MTRIIVTGGAGYVGSHACKALAAAGYLPVVYDNLSTGNRWAVRYGALEIGDILNPARLHEVFRQYRAIAVMHFAGSTVVGESMLEPARYYRNNVVGTINLLDAARAHDVSAIVFSSSCATYGTPEKVPITEDTPQRPVSPYGASKLMAERTLADYAMSYGLRCACLRYFNAAGADPAGEIGEHRTVETHLLPLLLDAVLGTRPPLTVFGTDYPTPDGTAIRDYVHVSDLAAAHVAALRYLLGGGHSICLNLGTGHGHSVREVIGCAERITGRPVPHQVAPRREGDAPELVADPSRSLALLPFEFRHFRTLEEIVASAWQWHRRKRVAVVEAD
jgi:UDP-glucose-4-epimerase GalE